MRALARARRLQEAGRLDDALAGYTAFLERHPTHAAVHHAVALLHAQAGRMAAAETAARRALSVSDDPAARLTLGRVLLETGRVDEALAELQGVSSALPAARYDLARALRRAGRPAAALHTLRRFTSDEPAHAGAWNELGVALMACGEPQESRACFERSLALRPRHVPTLANLGAACQALGRLGEADRALTAALARDPDAPTALARRAGLRKVQGRVDDALADAGRLVELAPDDADAQALLGSVSQAAGALPQAEAAFRAALALRADHPGARAGLAELLEWQGRYESGLEVLGDDNGEAEVALARARLLRRVGRLDEALDILRREPAAAGAAMARHWAFTLGDVLDGLGRYAEAFDAWSRGNAILPGTYDPSAHARWVGRLRDASAAVAPALPVGGRPAGSGRVFIVGMPRSGTSLVEQILAAHPSVYAAGEQAVLGRIAHELEGFPESLAALDPAAAEALGRRYLEEVPGDGAAVVTDKMPLNFLYLGLVARILPGARVIHCRRDARDAAVSCFATNFIDPALAFAGRLDWLAHWIGEYRRLMDHWSEVLPLATLRVDYESLVADLDRGARELVAFAGLPWDAACLAPESVARVVHTASHAQVREAVHTRSVGRWRLYEQPLAPLLAALDDAGPSVQPGSGAGA